MSAGQFMRNGAVVIALGFSIALAAPTRAEDWRKIDFDADLTTYLIDIDRIKHSGDAASVLELNVPGRTSIATGAESHTVFERRFDCAKGTEKLGEIIYYRNLADGGRKLAHPETSFSVRRGSLDEIMFEMACHGAAAPNASGYISVTQAVHRAFMDAIKLPADQSVRTRRAFEPPGQPLIGSPDIQSPQ
jgi:hypothetical protein